MIGDTPEELLARMKSLLEEHAQGLVSIQELIDVMRSLCDQYEAATTDNDGAGSVDGATNEEG